MKRTVSPDTQPVSHDTQQSKAKKLRHKEADESKEDYTEVMYSPEKMGKILKIQTYWRKSRYQHFKNTRTRITNTTDQNKVILMKILQILNYHYMKYGMCEGSELYDRDKHKNHPPYSIVTPKSFGSKRRKVISEELQDNCDKIFTPILQMYIFGKDFYDEINKHISSIKITSLKVSESYEQYKTKFSHHHVDGKIGIPAPNDKCQRNYARLLTSISPKNLNEDATCYLEQQPIVPFAKIRDFHEYMRKRCGEENTKVYQKRPHYFDPRTVKLKMGELAYNPSHPSKGSQPIHAEPNPVPDRWLLVFDFISKHPGKKKQCIPEQKIRDSLRQSVAINNSHRKIDCISFINKLLKTEISNNQQLLLTEMREVFLVEI